MMLELTKNGGATLADLIYAFSTPAVPSALQILRVSGAGAAAFVDRCFRFGSLEEGWSVSGQEPMVSDAPVCERSLEALPGYRMAYGYIYDPFTQKPIDQVVALRYRAPHSYTGEEMVELSLHGSLALRRQVLDLMAKLGGRMAAPGEFTERAFLHGKLDLIQAEAVIDLIEARASRTSDQALRRLGGQMTRTYQDLQEAVIDLIAELQLAIDYPEHEDSIVDEANLTEAIRDLRERCEVLLQSYRQGRILQEGFKVVLMGPPNAGKSSLLNRLLRQDRAIVSDIPGTTRDTIEGYLSLEGLPVQIIDTAGLRESEDPIEQLGVERSRQAAEAADLIFYLLPRGEVMTEEIASEIKQYQKMAPLRLLRSKEDLRQEADKEGSLAGDERLVNALELPAHAISVETGEGLDSLFDMILEAYEALGSAQSEDLILSSEREHGILLQIQDQLERMENDVSRLPEDLIAQALMAVAEQLGELTGTIASEAVIENLFSRFCVGK